MGVRPRGVTRACGCGQAGASAKLVCLRYKFPVRPASRPTARHIKANCGGLAARNEPVRLPLLLARRLPHAPWSLTRLARAAGCGVGGGQTVEMDKSGGGTMLRTPRKN